MEYVFRQIRNNSFGLMAIILFLIGYMQVLRFNNYQNSFYFNTAINATNYLSNIKFEVKQFLNLPKENAALVQQNARLLLLLKNNIKQTDSWYAAYKNQYDVTAAKIVNGSTQNQNNYFTINRGSKQGIYVGEAVLGPNGVVGIIVQTSEYFSLVMPLINTKYKITPEILELEYSNGIISWPGRDAAYLELTGISKFKPLKEGMHLVTSKYSKAFPPGIPIGTVEKITTETNSSFYTVKVKTAANFNGLNNLYIVKHKYVPQIDTMEAQIIMEDLNGN